MLLKFGIKSTQKISIFPKKASFQRSLFLKGESMTDQLVHLTDENFQKSIAQGLTLVDFHATWCGPCRMIAPIVEKLAGHVQGKAKVAKLDIDQAPQVSQKLQITSVPTLILFKDGKELKRIVGVKDFDYLLNLIETASA